MFKPLFNSFEKALSNSDSYDEAVKKILEYSFNILDTKALDQITTTFINADLSARYFAAQKRPKKFAEEDVSDTELLRMKIGMTMDEYKELHEKYKNFAFTVAGAESNEQTQDILNALIANREAGGGYKEFTVLMKEKGCDVNSQVYWQNIRACQNAGQYQQMMKDIDIAPYWEYRAIKDDLTRPPHLAMHGMIRRYDDPIWDKWYPPNGWRCRCRVRSLSIEYLKSKLNMTESDILEGAPDLDEIKKNIGARYTVDFAAEMKKNVTAAGKLDLVPDRGFTNNVGKDMYDWLKTKESISPSEWEYMVKNKENLAKELSTEEAKKLPLFPYDKTKDFAEQKKEAEKLLKDMFDADNIILDRSGKPVYIADVKKFIDHITEEQPDRLKYISLVKEIIKNPDIIVQNVCVRPAEMEKNKKIIRKWNKKGQVKIVNEYAIKIDDNGKTNYISLSLNFSQGHDKNVLWTLQIRNHLKGHKVY